MCLFKYQKPDNVILTLFYRVLCQSAHKKKHLVSDWSMEDLDASDWLKFLIFVKYFFFKNIR